MSEREELEKLRTEMQAMYARYSMLALWAEMEEIMQERSKRTYQDPHNGRQFRIWLDHATANAVFDAAKNERISPSRYIRNAVLARLQQHQAVAYQ